MKTIKYLPPKKPDDSATIRVAAYCRVSTKSEEQKSSIELQKKAFEALIERMPRWKCAGIFADVASGRNLCKRSDFAALMALCRGGKVDLILTKSLSKFGRNSLDTLKILAELRRLEIDVWFETENIHLLQEVSRLPIEILVAMAQGESESKSENIRWGLRHAFQNPDSKTSHFICYGYEHDECGQLSIKKDEAEVVRLIFELRAMGMSLRKIADRLEERGVLSPRGKKQWSSETLNKLLRNEKYIGQVVLQKTFVADLFSGRQVRNKGERAQWLIENHHEAIVEEDMFGRVQ